MNMTPRRILGRAAVATLATGALGLGAGVAHAQPVTQNGLVNVNLQDVTVAIPIALAANVCDVNVAVLVGALEDTGATDCDASAGSDSDITLGEGGGPVSQNGLINVNVTDLVVSVPIGIAANICDVSAGVLVGQLRDDGTADCASVADAVSTIG